MADVLQLKSLSVLEGVEQNLRTLNEIISFIKNLVTPQDIVDKSSDIIKSLNEMDMSFSIISTDLKKIVDESIYHFAEDLISIIGNISEYSEEKIRNDINLKISNLITKKVKRKLFIDSLALQVTNDLFIEDYVNKKITLDDIDKNYIKELKSNKNSNQLNMTEDLKLDDIYANVKIYFDMNIKPKIIENNILVENSEKLIVNSRKELEEKLKKLINDSDYEYLKILKEEIQKVVNEEEIKEDEEGVDNMENNIDVLANESVETHEVEKNKFDVYDDMTLFNKVILSLNTKEEKLTRREEKINKRKEEVDTALEKTNKNIEANINRENELSQRKYELSQKEVELNSKLSETEVIFLNIKPLIKGLSNINSSSNNGGDNNE